MFRFRNLATVLMLSLAVALTGSTQAQEVQSIQSAEKAALAKEAFVDQLDLTKALEQAEQKIQGARLLSVRLEEDDGQTWVQAYFLSPTGIKEIRIDPTSGQAREAKDVRDTAEIGGEPLADTKKATEDARIGLMEAMRRAAAQVPEGKPIEAEMRLMDGKPIAEVELLSGDQVRKVWIDVVDGK